MEQALPDVLHQATLLSLDHDLAAGPGEPDPGDGLQIASYLAATSHRAPVIVHSSNGPRAALMMHTLREAHWSVTRVPPIGADWIETDWHHVISETLASGESTAPKK